MGIDRGVRREFSRVLPGKVLAELSYAIYIDDQAIRTLFRALEPDVELLPGIVLVATQQQGKEANTTDIVSCCSRLKCK